MTQRIWKRRAAAATLLAVSIGACDFIDISQTDPNIITKPQLAELFTGAQVLSYAFAEGNIARVSSVYMQQLGGADRQFAGIDKYEIGEDEVSGAFDAVYGGGGLVDLRKGRAIADSVGCDECSALFQIHEAYLIGMTASTFGDIPYREAVKRDEFPTPHLDPQEQVYADVQALLDDAITSLSAGLTAADAVFFNPMAGVDLQFGGDRAAWAAVAQTLKARFYMHWVEAQQAGQPEAGIACGGDCLTKAREAAMLGIDNAAGNWKTRHNASLQEANFWYLFMGFRGGYIVGGDFLIERLKERSDPRIALYYEPVSGGQYRGSSPGEADQSASILSESGAGSPDWENPIASCTENSLILAEVAHRQNQLGQAREHLVRGVECEEDLYGLDVPLPDVAALSGTALLSEIMFQKYAAQFLNIEVWNDYKRTCLPDLTGFENREIPGRLLYGQNERETNPNVPTPDQQPRRNQNDPAACG